MATWSFAQQFGMIIFGIIFPSTQILIYLFWEKKLEENNKKEVRKMFLLDILLAIVKCPGIMP